MNGTRTETYEEAVERIMRAVRRGELTFEQAAAEMRDAHKLAHECDGPRVEYEWRRKHAKAVRRG